MLLYSEANFEFDHISLSVRLIILNNLFVFGEQNNLSITATYPQC